MARKLKLYVWPEFLRDYTSGVAFALAENEDAARTLIMEAVPHEYGKKQARQDLLREPDVYEDSVGFAISGGD